MELVFATHNLNKVREIRSLLPDTIKLLSLSDINCFESIEEYGKTLEENAMIKMRFVKAKFNLDCFADDSGLEVTSLSGAPGVHSARYSGFENNAEKNIEKLLRALKNQNDRSAQFRTVIALSFGGENKVFEGVVRGSILKEKKGENGFGYDPVFKPEGVSKSFGELTFSEKNEMSHRAIAFNSMVSFLNSKIC